MKYVPYVPLALKPNMKSKAKAKPKLKPKPKPKMHNLGEASSSEYDREWADIDDFLTDLSDSKASRFPDLGLPAPVRATNPLGSLHQGITFVLNGTS
jgi:hypothetical protein